MIVVFGSRKTIRPALIFGYAAFEGLFVGGISAYFEYLWPGIVVQATVATLAVVGVTLALFASGKVRASKRATKVFMIAMIGYLVFGLINVVMMMFGAFSGPDSAGPFGIYSQQVFGIPLGLIIGVLVVIMAAYSLVLDFDSIQQGVRNGAPRAVRLARRLRHHGDRRLAVHRDPAHPRDPPRQQLAAVLPKGPSRLGRPFRRSAGRRAPSATVAPPTFSWMRRPLARSASQTEVTRSVRAGDRLTRLGACGSPPPYRSQDGRVGAPSRESARSARRRGPAEFGTRGEEPRSRPGRGIRPPVAWRGEREVDRDVPRGERP